MMNMRLIFQMRIIPVFWLTRRPKHMWWQLKRLNMKSQLHEYSFRFKWWSDSLMFRFNVELFLLPNYNINTNKIYLFSVLLIQSVSLSFDYYYWNQCSHRCTYFCINSILTCCRKQKIATKNRDNKLKSNK